MLPQMNREPMNLNADDEHYKALKTHQDTHKDSFSFHKASTVAVQCKDGER